MRNGDFILESKARLQHALGLRIQVPFFDRFYHHICQVSLRLKPVVDAKHDDPRGQVDAL